MACRGLFTRRIPGRSLAFAALAALLCAGLLPLGCKSKPKTLETGYRYDPLNSTTVQRRAFYADPYSVEARRAEMERQQRMEGDAGFGLGR